MTRHAREAISLAIATTIGEVALLALVTTEWSNVGGVALVFAFVIGPPLFLAMVAWRRRTHPERSRLLFGVAVAVALGGLGVLSLDLYRVSTDPLFRKTPNMHSVLVPVVQWSIILVVWLVLVVQETREKRAAGKAGQSAQAPK